MNYRMHIGVLLVLCLAYLTACMRGSRPPDPPHVAPPDPPACHAVCVTITDNEIASSRVTFLAGRAYSFVVTNQGKAANMSHPKH
jgi:hypothetical protein